MEHETNQVIQNIREHAHHERVSHFGLPTNNFDHLKKIR